MSIIQHAAPEPGAAVPESTTANRARTDLQRAVLSRVDLARAAIVDRAWEVLHALGAHRWSDGYDVDPERGMTRYRGSRCSICDNPWEGW